MLLLLCKGQELPVFACVYLMNQPILLTSRECVRPYCLIRERNGMEYWSHQQTYVSTGFGDLSFAPCPRLNLDKPGERPTRFNRKRQECISALLSFYSIQRPTPLLFLMELNPRRTFYIMVNLPSSFRGS